MNTYFVLSKKDRSGFIQIRPFHQVLQEMKRKENEEAKVKQATIIRNANRPESQTTLPKQNGHDRTPTPNDNTVSRSAGSVDVNVPAKMKRDTESNIALNSFPNTTFHKKESEHLNDGSSEHRDTIVSNQTRYRSKACQLL